MNRVKAKKKKMIGKHPEIGTGEELSTPLGWESEAGMLSSIHGEWEEWERGHLAGAVTMARPELLWGKEGVGKDRSGG